MVDIALAVLIATILWVVLMWGHGYLKQGLFWIRLKGLPRYFAHPVRVTERIWTWSYDGGGRGEYRYSDKTYDAILMAADWEDEDLVVTLSVDMDMKQVRLPNADVSVKRWIYYRLRGEEYELYLMPIKANEGVPEFHDRGPNREFFPPLQLP